MAHFYGSVKGNRGEATRLGTTEITTVAASWEGAVRVDILRRTNTCSACSAVRREAPEQCTGNPGGAHTWGVDWAHVALIPWRGHGVNHILYDGPVSGATFAALDALRKPEPAA